VRYLDMRVCEDHLGHLFLCHSVYAADFLDSLDEIRDFLDTNTKEIVIIDIHSVIWSSGEKSTVADALMGKFDSLVIDERLNEAVSALWMADKRVVILYDDDERFWPRSAIKRPWPKCHLGYTGALEMISFNEQLIADDSSHKILVVNDLECSPNVWDIMKGFLLPAIYPSSLYENTQNFVYPMLMSTIQGSWSNFTSNSFNIIMVDFIQEEVINWAIMQNSKATRIKR